MTNAIEQRNAAMSAAAAAHRRRTRAPRSSRNNREIDAVVGQRIKTRRILMGLSQEALADRIGVTFQQIQKYEKGANALTVSRLVEVSEALDVPISYLIDGLREPGDSGQADKFGRMDLEMVRAFRSIPSQEVREGVYRMLRTIADNVNGG